MDSERLSLDKIQLELETFYNFVILKLKSHCNLLNKYIFPKLKNQHLPKKSLIKKSKWKNISHFSHVMFNILLTILIVQSKSCLQLLTYAKKFVSLIKIDVKCAGQTKIQVVLFLTRVQKICVISILQLVIALKISE